MELLSAVDRALDRREFREAAASVCSLKVEELDSSGIIEAVRRCHRVLQVAEQPSCFPDYSVAELIQFVLECVERLKQHHSGSWRSNTHLLAGCLRLSVPLASTATKVRLCKAIACLDLQRYGLTGPAVALICNESIRSLKAGRFSNCRELIDTIPREIVQCDKSLQDRLELLKIRCSLLVR